jgi:hypothetical protein
MEVGLAIDRETWSVHCPDRARQPFVATGGQQGVTRHWVCGSCELSFPRGGISEKVRSGPHADCKMVSTVSLGPARLINYFTKRKIAHGTETKFKTTACCATVQILPRVSGSHGRHRLPDILPLPSGNEGALSVLPTGWLFYGL